MEARPFKLSRRERKINLRLELAAAAGGRRSTGFLAGFVARSKWIPEPKVRLRRGSCRLPLDGWATTISRPCQVGPAEPFQANLTSATESRKPRMPRHGQAQIR